MRFLNHTEAEFADFIRSIGPVIRPRPEWKRWLFLCLLAQLEAGQQTGHAWRLRASLTES